MIELPDRVTVVEVGPRDGLQSFGRWVETDHKVAMIDRLSEAGFPAIEATSFAHPHVVPHLKDAEEVMARIKRRQGTLYRALVPNAKGAERAVQAGADEILGLITVSATYLEKNQNMTMGEAIDEAVAAFRIASEAGLGFAMAVGMAFRCPYEGRIAEDKVLTLIRRFYDAGMRQLYLAASLGLEDPRHVNALFHRVTDEWPEADIGFHVHDLAGFGMANVLAALDGGARFIEGSICGVGGGIAMPSAMGAIGNLASEDIVHALNEMGIDTGVATDKALSAARDIAELLDIEPANHVSRCVPRSDGRSENAQDGYTIGARPSPAPVSWESEA